ncbi:hypothetical protein DFS33DRAFT_136268 [Desarmillaria ectypa]|nr:hypothetical protein DFS33DRAFT_136268 [Desarmillaria ectypa]
MRWRIIQWNTEDTAERGESTTVQYDYGRLQFYPSSHIPKLSQVDDRYINSILDSDADTNGYSGIDELIKKFDDLATATMEIQGQIIFMYPYHKLQTVLRLIHPISIAVETLEPSFRRIASGDENMEQNSSIVYYASIRIDEIGRLLRDSQFWLPTFFADGGRPCCDIAIGIVSIVALVTGVMGAVIAKYAELIKLMVVTTAIVTALLYIRRAAQLVGKIIYIRDALFQDIVTLIWSFKKFDEVWRRHGLGRHVSPQEIHLLSLLYHYFLSGSKKLIKKERELALRFRWDVEFATPAQASAINIPVSQPTKSSGHSSSHDRNGGRTTIRTNLVSRNRNTQTAGSSLELGELPQQQG